MVLSMVELWYVWILAQTCVSELPKIDCFMDQFAHQNIDLIGPHEHIMQMSFTNNITSIPISLYMCGCRLGMSIWCWAWSLVLALGSKDISALSSELWVVSFSSNLPFLMTLRKYVFFFFVVKVDCNWKRHA